MKCFFPNKYRVILRHTHPSSSPLSQIKETEREKEKKAQSHTNWVQHPQIQFGNFKTLTHTDATPNDNNEQQFSLWQFHALPSHIKFIWFDLDWLDARTRDNFPHIVCASATAQNNCQLANRTTVFSFISHANRCWCAFYRYVLFGSILFLFSAGLIYNLDRRGMMIAGGRIANDGHKKRRHSHPPTHTHITSTQNQIHSTVSKWEFLICSILFRTMYSHIPTSTIFARTF